jgi:hypothetical protein
MKQYLEGFWFSLPVQLLLLHFRRYQVLLIVWYILWAIITGNFMRTFGADSLFLAPEYFGEVTALSTAIVGFSLGIFFMSWNITTFILHSKHLRFLATTAQPFLKYCINNALLPVIFMIIYFIRAINYARYQELFHGAEIILMVSGFAGGTILSIALSFLYFFGADKTIYYNLSAVIKKANTRYAKVIQKKVLPKGKTEFRIDWFLSARFQLRKPRDVRHYPEDFLDTIFTRHHFAAIIAIVLAFIFLVLVGYISDTRLFQFPAAASITLFFAVLIAVAGALSLFLHSWSIPLVVVVYMGVNLLYQKEIIDPRNKAYGLDYINKQERPLYSRDAILQMASDSNMAIDKQQWLGILNRWKARQKTVKPILYIINTSGGGTRSATFTMNTLQRLDSLFGGHLMEQTFLINGASGGMLGAAYFRELYYQKIKGAHIDMRDKKYVADISKDLLNPLFSSFVTRDMVGPVQKFTVNGFEYAKDRGYAFERKLAENTDGMLSRTLQYYESPENEAVIPTMWFNSVISRDGRKMIIGTHPARFLMRQNSDSNHISSVDPDAVDFRSFFGRQRAMDINILSALRMNATFPYILPNVWLPSNPVIDVMDAGLRDNFGQEATLRFIYVFRHWLRENTSKVVLLQMRDGGLSDWEKPEDKSSLLGMLTKPLLILQNNWYKLQDYQQNDQLEYLSASYGPQFYRAFT